MSTVVVDDGEAGEASIIQVRARMYYLDRSTNADGKEDIAWRERGAGILKVNVPVSSVVIDPETGVANPKSFDVSVLKESTPENPKLVRLLMRQDSTLRVILNSVMLAKMDFQLKEGLKAKSVLFTAIEGEDAKHVQVQMKVCFSSLILICILVWLYLEYPEITILSPFTDESPERGYIPQGYRRSQEET